MTVHLNQEHFDSLETSAIGHTCFAPMVPVYQSGLRGKSAQEAAAFRAAFYQSLWPGQRALFMFFTWYDHAIRSECAFLRMSQQYLAMRIFDAVKKAAEYFGDAAMFHLLKKAERILAENKESEIPMLYRALQELSPHTLALIGTHIKERPADFVIWI